MAIKATAAVTLTAVVDVAATYRYYLLQSSTLSRPSKPTANPPGGNWSDTEPTYTSGSTNSLYFCDLTVFSDGTWSYSSVSLSSAYEAAKAAYNKALVAQSTAAQALSHTSLIVGTQTAATGSWTGNASFSSLQDGQQIVYWLPFAGSGNATLNLTLSGGTTTGAVPCYYGGTTRLTTHYAAGNAIHLTYRANVTIGSTTIPQGWWADANYNMDTYDRVRLNNSVLAKSAIAASQLIVSDASGYFPLSPSVAFDLTKPILWAGSAISAGASGSNNYLSFPSCTLRNNLVSYTGTSQKTCFLVGKISGDMFTPESGMFVTDLPEEEDGLVYISLGVMVSTYQIYLYPEHPIFAFVGDAFKNLNIVASEAYHDLNLQIANVYAEISTTADSIRQEVMESYASIDNLNEVSEEVSTLAEQTSSNFTWTATQIRLLNDDLGEAKRLTNEQLELIQTYTTFDQDGLKIGKVGNPFTFRVINDRLSFYMNETEVAYLSNNKLYVTQAEILTKLQIGAFAFEPQSNGNLSLIYCG